MTDLQIANGLDMRLEHLIGQRTAVLGTSGMGKSNTVAVLIENLAPHLPIAIIDPHNEYYGLCEKFPFLRAGKAPDVDVEAGPEQAAQLAEFSFTNRVSIILSMLFMTDDERLEFVYAFCSRLWELNLLVKQPYAVVLDEAQNFIPQNAGKSPALKKLKQFALEGRKFGFTVILSSQRTAEVNKTILGQCGIAFLHGVDIYNDVEAYAGMLPYSSAETKRIALQLGVGECIVKFKPEGRAHYFHPVKINRRQTFDASKTPGAEAATLLQARQLDAALIASLQAVVEAATELKQLKEPDALHAEMENEFKQKMKAAETTIATKDAEIKRLNDCIAEMQKQTAPVPKQLSLLKPLVEEWDGRSELVTQRAIKRQEREFQSLMQDIRRMDKPKRMILCYLTQRESVQVDERTLARMTGYSLGTLRPRPLIDMGLVKRTLNVGRTVYFYQSTARHKINSLCPDLDSDKLIDQIWRLEKI